MKPEVFFIENRLVENLKALLKEKMDEGGTIGIKVHFGERGNLNYIRPSIVGAVVDVLKEKEKKPYIFDTSTLYEGGRENPKIHRETAKRNGFTEESMGCPLLFSDESENVKGNRLEYGVAKNGLAEKLLVLSHVKGHRLTGFGGAIKNLGMGCVDSKTKGKIHESSMPEFVGNCVECEACLRACPFDAIKIENEKPIVDEERCLGCAKCVEACKKGAIKARVSNLRVLLADAASAVLSRQRSNPWFVNLLMDISPLCDCVLDSSICERPFMRDLGILISKDPIAIDSASLDLIDESQKKNVFKEMHGVDPREMLREGEALGLGSTKYSLIRHQKS